MMATVRPIMLFGELPLVIGSFVIAQTATLITRFGGSQAILQFPDAISIQRILISKQTSPFGDQTRDFG